MIWLNIFVTALVGGFVSSIFLFLSKKNLMSRVSAQWLTVGIMVLSVFIMNSFGTPYYLASTFEGKIKKEDPIFLLLALESPLGFNNYINKIKQSYYSNESANIPFYTGEYIYAELRKYSPYGSNQQFYDLAQATENFYNKVYPVDPALVVDMEFNLPATGQALQNTHLGPMYTDALLPITQDKKLIIQSAIKSPQPALSETDKDRAQAIIQGILINLNNDYGNEAVYNTFNRPNDPATNQKLSAEIIIKFYQMLLNHGKDDAGLTVKYLFSMANGKK